MPEGVSIGGLSGTLSIEAEFAAQFDAFINRIDDVQNATVEAGKTIDEFSSKVTEASKAAADAVDANMSGIADSVAKPANAFQELVQTIGTNIQGLLPQLENLKAGIEDSISHPLEFAKGAAIGFIEALGPVGVAITAFAGVAALAGKEIWDLGESAAAAGGKINDLSEKMSLSTERTSKLKFAFDVAGGSIDQASNLIFMMQRRMSDSPDAFQKGLDKIKLSISDLQDLKPDEQIYAISKAFQENTDQTNRSSTAMALFSRQGREAIPLLMKDLQGLSEQSSNLVTIWDEESAKAAEEFEMASRKLQLQLEDLAVTAGKILIPRMTEIENWASQGIEKFKEWGLVTAILAGEMSGLGGPIGKLLGIKPVEPFVGPIEQKEPELNPATKKSIDATEKLWEEYYVAVDKMAGDSVAAQIAKVNEWYTTQQKTLDKTAATNKNFGDQQVALNALYWQKLQVAGTAGQKAIADANTAMAKKTQGFLDEAAQNAAKLEGDSLDVKMAALDTWYNREYADIVSSKSNWTEKNKAIDALNQDLFDKMQATEKEFFDKEADALATRVQAFEKIGEAAAAAVAKGMGGGQNVLKGLAQAGAQFQLQIAPQVVSPQTPGIGLGAPTLPSIPTGVATEINRIATSSSLATANLTGTITALQALVTKAPEVVHGGELVSSNMEGYSRTASLAADSVENLAGENQRLVGGAEMTSHALQNVSKDVGLVGTAWTETQNGLKAFLSTSDEVNSRVVVALNAARDAVKPVTEETSKWIDELDKAGYSVEQIAAITKTSFAQVQREVDGSTQTMVKNLESVFSNLPTVLMHAFEGGGNFLGAMKSLALQVGDVFYKSLSDAIAKAVKDKQSALNSTTLKAAAGFGLTTGITAAASGASVGQSAGAAAGAGLGAATSALESGASLGTAAALSATTMGISFAASLAIKGIQALFSIGGPSQTELAGRSLEKTFQDSLGGIQGTIDKIGEAYRTIGKTNEQAQADIKALLAAEKQGPAAVQAIIDKLDESLKRAQEINDAISGLNIQSHDDLVHAADIANAAYEKVAAGVASGQFTAEDAAKAYMAYQQALAATGDAAAKIWVDAHQGMVDFTTAASNAGYQTQADLQKAADAALQLAQNMRDSGKYTAADITDAFNKAKDAAMKAAGISQDLIDKQKALTQAVGQEAPEAVMGSIEKEQRAQLDAINKQINGAGDVADAQAQAAADAANDWQNKMRTSAQTTTTQFDATAQTTQDNFTDAAAATQTAFTTAATNAAKQMQDIFNNIHLTANVDFGDVTGEAEAAAAAVEKSWKDHSQMWSVALTTDAQNVADQMGAKYDIVAGQAAQSWITASATATAAWMSDSDVWSGHIASIVKDTTASVTTDFAQAASATQSSFEKAADGMDAAFVASAGDAAKQIEGIFAALNIVVPIHWDIPQVPAPPTVPAPPQVPGPTVPTPAPSPNPNPRPIPPPTTPVPIPPPEFPSGPYPRSPLPPIPSSTPRAEAEGGVGFASAPMTFSTQGNEFWAFGGENAGMEGLADKLGVSAQKPAPMTIQIFPGTKYMKEIVIDGLEQTPTDRDIRVLKGVTK